VLPVRNILSDGLNIKRRPNLSLPSFSGIFMLTILLKSPSLEKTNFDYLLARHTNPVKEMCHRGVPAIYCDSKTLGMLVVKFHSSSHLLLQSSCVGKNRLISYRTVNRPHLGYNNLPVSGFFQKCI